MIKITIDDSEVQKFLKNLANKVKNRRPLMQKLAGIMHDAVEENFKVQGRPKWQPLKPSTIIQRAKKGYWPGQILQQRGQLASSISQKYDHNSAQVGTNKKYAAIHQFGGKAGRGRKVTIPARPFLMLDDRDLQQIKDKIKDYLNPI